MKPSPYDIYWSDSKNWKSHVFYVCHDDPRVIVPKRPKWMGRTLNFAHPKAFVVLLLTFLALAIPVFVRPYIDPKIWALFFVGTIVAIVAFYYCFDLQENG